MKRRIRYMALVLVLCMLALTGCAQPRDTMTLRVCLDAAPATLDPAMASSDAERTVVAHLFENLMKLSRGEDGSIQPVYAAAKSYTVEDNLDGTETYTFTLRQNVRWSDGQTVTAHDFVYAWQRLAKKILSVWLSSTIAILMTSPYVSTIMFNIEFSYPIPTHCNCVYSTTFLKSKSSSFFLVLLLLFSEPEDDLLPVFFEELFPLLLPVFPVELLP